MRKVDIIPFELKHAEQIRGLEPSLFPLEFGDFRKAIENNTKDSPAWTGVCDNKVIGCGGIRMFWKGVGEAWCIYPKSLINSYIKECFSYTGRVLDAAVRVHGLHRIQSTVRSDFGGAMNWLRHLGFEIEGRLKRYNSDGTDSYLCCRKED